MNEKNFRTETSKEERLFTGWDISIEAYETVLTLDPSDYLARFRRGGMLEKLGQYNEAAQAYRDVIQLQPENYWAWNDLGRVLETMQDYDHSIVAYDRAIQLHPTFDAALAGRDRVLHQLQPTLSLMSFSTRGSC